MKRPPIRWQAFLWIAACGVVGYAAGKARSPVEKAASDGRLSASHVRHTGSRDPREEVDAFENFENLLSAESRETDIWKVVSRLPKEKIPDALLRLRTARASTGNRSPEADRLHEIECALYFHWAESDPVAALADVSAIPEPADPHAKTTRRNLAESMLAAWMRVDPNEAYRAVKDHKDFGFVGRNLLVQTWTAENVFENLKLFPDKHEDLLGWYCVAAAKDEEERNAMLTALKEQPQMQDRDWGYSMLFREWAARTFFELRLRIT
jgi:hypothetical protein